MDEVCPTFAHFTVHGWKLMKSSQYLTVLPSHFNNIFLKSFRLLPNLSRNFDILQTFPRFHKTNNISWSFSGIIKLQCTLLTFRFCFWYFQKMTAKFQFCSNRFKILKFQTWRWQKSQYRSYLKIDRHQSLKISGNRNKEVRNFEPIQTS